jgi:hypothetical protein
MERDEEDFAYPSFLLLSVTGSPAAVEIEVLFPTEVNIPEAFLKEIETLSETLDLALYQITSANKEKGAMNHCFAILDGKKVITGFHD